MLMFKIYNRKKRLNATFIIDGVDIDAVFIAAASALIVITT